jgi:hypothetical protein
MADPRYVNGLPAGPDFFPIGVWLQSPLNAPAYKAMGVNTFVGLYRGPTEAQLAELAKNGMYAIAAQNDIALNSHDSSVVKAWLQQDEPDNAQPGPWWKRRSCIPAAEVVAETRRLESRDPTRPVMINFGEGVADAGWRGRGTCTGDMQYYDIAARGAGILSFDIYPVADVRSAIRGKLDYIAHGVCNLRARLAPGQALWAGIETTAIGSHQRVTPAQLRSEVWLALIHGATGIYYFVHEWTSGFREDGIFRYPEIVAEVTAVDRGIARLAPVLNAPDAATAIDVSAPIAVDTRVKRLPEALYVFAVAMQNQAAKVRFFVPGIGNASAAVIDEDRAVAVAGGVFEDAFTGYGVHIYRIPVARGTARAGESAGRKPCAAI